MKKKVLFLLFLCFLLVSCRNPMDERMETDESSIFGMGEVEYCRITADTADVKAGIGNDFNTIKTLNRDDVIRVLSQVDDRYVVQLDNNEVGSIDTTDATPVVRDGNVQQLQTMDPDREPQIEDAVPEVQAGDQPPEAEAQPQTQSPAPQAAPARDTAIEGLSAVEEQMINLVNQERERNNLPILQVDLEVTRVARIKSQDMVDQNYFSHYSPTYGSPFEMLDSFGIKYLHAGENLAGNPSVEDAHTSLMNSSGHRKNILSPDFTHIGIGVKPSGRYGQIFTQLFISKPQ
ncbi:SCP-like extracellular protein [Clostridium aceticum]|uniref:SCP-like extracellular protein n=1 Tax=Clostridium aceticum TaxID=84022 RepID=A0A0D8I837_9CLOT|nr:CAP domain-containing protein [Clostridium aceticum]AKL97209.1 SCP-like extracellular protein [Clostridium aceticum]KJF26244.1 SCP-like extracellular protein [Clostridium aceticum]